MSKISSSQDKPDSAAAGSDLLHRNLATAVIAFHEAVARRSGLGVSEHKCLGVLALTGPTTAGELARQSGFTTGAITGIVDRLEKAGLVRRAANPLDRRSVIIHPLQQERHLKKVKPVFQPLSEAMARLRQSYSAQELAMIDEYLVRTTDILKEQAQSLDS